MTTTYLFNSILAPSLSDEFYNFVSQQKNFVPSNMILYATSVNELPKTFDPRTPQGIPQKDVAKWFYNDDKGQKLPILCTQGCLDQGTCGSCWAFASTVTFTDAARLNINRIYGPEKSCYISSFFQVVYTCTGDTGIGNRGNTTNIYAQETRNGISTYYVVAFSPKFVITLDSDGKDQFSMDTVCETALQNFTMSNQNPGQQLDALKIFGSEYNVCTGCRGNLIPYPFILFTSNGAPLVDDFPLHEWACFVGLNENRAKFCSEEYLTGVAKYPPPKLFTADKFSFSTRRDIELGRAAKGMTNMVDWIKSSIYEYGPVTIGFEIFDSFEEFFQGPQKREIYTAKVFIEDKKYQASKGGHAVTIVGWGEVGNIKYWIVRNTWGLDWGDSGFFRIEQNIDEKLKEAKLEQRFGFEDLFCALYFAPFPNPLLYDKSYVNDMKKFLQTVPNATCATFDAHPEVLTELTKDCQCRCGFYFSSETHQCERATRYVGAPFPTSIKPPTPPVLLLLLLLFCLILIVIMVCSHVFGTEQVVNLPNYSNTKKSFCRNFI